MFKTFDYGKMAEWSKAPDLGYLSISGLVSGREFEPHSCQYLFSRPGQGSFYNFFLQPSIDAF